MGKRQHQKDKMYITCAEYTQFYGGKKAGELGPHWGIGELCSH
uniref:Uncharacterized protein n=1 Tax=Anas platyrhynchos platyrhynchos TaxID=8840 RepID=A0A493TDM2_ANAPP